MSQPPSPNSAVPASSLPRTIVLACAMVWSLTALIPFVPKAGSNFDAVTAALLASPPKALALGIFLALAGLVPSGVASGWGKVTARYLMQTCIVLAGLTMDVKEVLHAGLTGIAFTIATILGSFALGWFLHRLLKTDGKVTTLLSSGTAICGGSAIAAVSPVIGATSAQISIAMATVFVLNGVALYTFPPLGDLLHLSASQFGTWAGIAIHDTSSVYGAGQVFDHHHPGSDALQQAMAVKLSRALWIAPIVFVAAWYIRKIASREEIQARTPFPWFILWFIAACALRSYLPSLGEHRDSIRLLAGGGMTMALLLIGIGLSRAALKTVGVRPMLQGAIQWLALGISSLLAVRWSIT